MAASIDEAHQLARDLLLEDERPTAIFAHNDVLALGVLDALAAANLRCPEDVSIVGYDDLTISAYVTPPLTTVRLPTYQIGRMAAELAVALIEGEPEHAVDILLQPTLVVRSSTAPPPEH